jgi:SWI/SNF chromatin-remodeling complex subunit SWI1
MIGGWDARAVSSTFPKNNLARPTRSVHELGIVDMEAILMGLRSRMPRELGYAMTVLAMLSMPHPEEQIGGLPLQHLSDIYMELLELIGEVAGPELQDNGLERLSFLELQALGHDTDFSLEPTRDHTGGKTDLVLAGLNLLRNFSMTADNHRLMADVPELFTLLASVSDARLGRLPFEDSTRPYSILELARVRRDCVCILTNLGGHVDLRRIPAESTLAIFRLLASFLTSGWETLLRVDSPYGPCVSPRDRPPPTLYSVNRALEAFSRLSAVDSNREVLSQTPADELLALYKGLVKLLPMDRRSFEAVHSLEDVLAHTETLALSIYSLVFLSPLPVRTEMRRPEYTQVILRVILDTIPHGPDFNNNPFAILCRRLCETMGLMNGTVGAEEGEVTMGFGAGGDSRWKFGGDVVVRGWLAAAEERIMEAGFVKQLDKVTLEELEKMWCGM